MSDAYEPGSSDERPLVGARFRHHAKPRERPSRSEASSGGFPVVRRGYDRQEVDARLEELHAELDRLRAELGAARGRLDDTRAEVERLQHEAWQLRTQRGEPEPAPSPLGPLAEKIVRSAQREAMLIRATAQKEAGRILEAARAQVLSDAVVPHPRVEFGSTS